MNKARKKLLVYTMLAVFALLVILLGIINFVNFDMAANDADEITAMLAQRGGSFSLMDESGSMEPGMKGPGGRHGNRPSDTQLAPDQLTAEPPTQGEEAPEAAPEFSRTPRGMNRMGGPGSPELESSVRYFTYAFESGDEEAQNIAFRLSAVDEAEAAEWARSLLKEAEKGWTQGSYRYRKYEIDGKTYVTVIDQGRELLPCYRILIISAVGAALGLLISFLFLLYASKRLFRPLEDADRKQKEFIASAEKEFKLPLTVISANTELIERTHGPSEETRSIRRQTASMNELIKRLGGLAVFKEEEDARASFSLSEFLQAELDMRAAEFEQKGIRIESDIEDGISLHADPEAVKRLVSELTDNALKFSKSRAAFSLKKHGERILLEEENDAELPEGSCDQIFDRFTRLENAENTDGAGLGLAAVKDILKNYSGRASAKVEGGMFKLTIAL